MNAFIRQKSSIVLICIRCQGIPHIDNEQQCDRIYLIRAEDIGSKTTRTSSFRLNSEGHTITDRGYSLTWDPVLYNWSAEHAIILAAEITYTDGTRENLSLSKVSTTKDILNLIK